MIGLLVAATLEEKRDKDVGGKSYQNLPPIYSLNIYIGNNTSWIMQYNKE